MFRMLIRSRVRPDFPFPAPSRFSSVRCFLAQYSVAAVLMLSAPRPALAQVDRTCTVQPTAVAPCEVSLSLDTDIPYMAQLSISSTSTALGTLSTVAFVRSVATSTVNATGPTVTTTANFAHQLTISAQSSTWTFTRPSGSTTTVSKAAGDLLWSMAAAGPFTSVTTTGAVIASSIAAGSGTVTGPIYLRSRWSWATDNPGTYSLALTITLAAP